MFHCTMVTDKLRRESHATGQEGRHLELNTSQYGTFHPWGPDEGAIRRETESATAGAPVLAYLGRLACLRSRSGARTPAPRSVRSQNARAPQSLARARLCVHDRDSASQESRCLHAAGFLFVWRARVWRTEGCRCPDTGARAAEALTTPLCGVCGAASLCACFGVAAATAAALG